MQGDLGVWEGVGRRGVRSGEGTGTAGGTLRTRLWRDMGYRALDRLEVLGEDRKDLERKRKGVFQVRKPREQRQTWGNADVIFK